MALIDGVDSVGYYSQPETEILPLTGERWEFDDEYGEHIIWFTRTLRRGETYEYRFRDVPDPEASTSGNLGAVMRAFNIPVARFTNLAALRGV